MNNNPVMNSDQLANLAEDGFPGLLLTDLVELTNELMDMLSSNDKSIELWEVTCQAFNNATVLAGRTSSVEKLRALLTSLERFHGCLANVSASNSTMSKVLALEYTHHTERRVEVISELIQQAESLSKFEVQWLPEEINDEVPSAPRPK